MPSLKSKANSSIQLESMRNGFGQGTITGMYQKNLNVWPLRSCLSCSVWTPSLHHQKGVPLHHEEVQLREMHLHGPGDPDQTVLSFNALESCGWKQLLRVLHIHRRCLYFYSIS